MRGPATRRLPQSFRGRVLLHADNLRRWLRFTENGQVIWQDKRDGRERGPGRRPALRAHDLVRWPLSGPASNSRARAACLALGIHWSAQLARGWPVIAEPLALVSPGRDVAGRRLWLAPAACLAWVRLQDAALAEGVRLLPVSGFRALAWQQRLLQQKLTRGLPLAEILRVNAPPGFSEHHSGTALDLAVPGQPMLTEAFASTPAFDWLRQRAGAFGFRLSFPRDNPLGLVYEPWHWRFHQSR